MCIWQRNLDFLNTKSRLDFHFFILFVFYSVKEIMSCIIMKDKVGKLAFQPYLLERK